MANKTDIGSEVPQTLFEDSKSDGVFHTVIAMNDQVAITGHGLERFNRGFGDNAGIAPWHASQR